MPRTIKAVGRLGITVADGVDADDEPEITYCDEGEVWLTPTTTIAQGRDSAGVKPLLGNSVTKLLVDSEGYLTYRGLRHVKVFDLTDPAFNPHVAPNKATHTVQFKGVKCNGVEVRFTDGPARLAADTVDPVTGECNIIEQMPVPVGAGVAIVVGPPGPPGDPELTDEVTAANLATGPQTRAALVDAAEDLGLGGGQAAPANFRYYVSGAWQARGASTTPVTFDAGLTDPVPIPTDWQPGDHIISLNPPTIP